MWQRLRAAPLLSSCWAPSLSGALQELLCGIHLQQHSVHVSLLANTFQVLLDQHQPADFTQKRCIDMAAVRLQQVKMFLSSSDAPINAICTAVPSLAAIESLLLWQAWGGSDVLLAPGAHGLHQRRRP